MSAHPVVVEIPLRWSDMDAYGHVNNAKFVTLLEEARVVALEKWFGHNGLLEKGVLVMRQEIDYVAQLTYRSTPVEVEVWCSNLGASSFEISYRMRDPESAGGTTYLLAETTLVRFDTKAGHTCRLDEEERRVLEQYSGDPAPLFSRRKRAK